MWEYKCLKFYVGERFITSNQSELNDLGKDGWELIEIVHDCGSTLNAIFYLKRKYF
jgi:hypothetical protein